MTVHQLYVAATPGDAIGNHMLWIDAKLRDWGLDTALYAQHIAPELAGRIRPDHEFLAALHAPAARPDDVLLYHYGLYTPNVRYYQAAQGRLRTILSYHNITPAHFFRGWSPELELLCDTGRRTLPGLVGADLALGDSEYNRQELVAAGFPAAQTAVMPLFSQHADLAAQPVDAPLLDQLRAGGIANFLTVGRVAPNKAIEDAIRIFAVYHHTLNPRSRLYVVGGRLLPAYDAALDALVDRLNLAGAVCFPGVALGGTLKAYYQAADLYLCASHHEGFCVPLVESMFFGVPILAHAAAAIPETLGDAGVLYTRPDYAQLAEMAHLLLTDAALRARVIARQRERLADLAPDRVEARLREVLNSLDVLREMES